MTTTPPPNTGRTGPSPVPAGAPPAEFYDRRQFLKLATSAAAATAITPFDSAAATRKLEALPPGIKISLQISTNATDEDLQFAQQLGVEYINIPTGGADATLENFIRLKQRVEAANLKVWNIGNSNVHNMQEVTLNLPGRDEKIEEYKTFLRNLAKANIYYTTYAHRVQDKILRISC